VRLNVYAEGKKEAFEGGWRQMMIARRRRDNVWILGICGVLKTKGWYWFYFNGRREGRRRIGGAGAMNEDNEEENDQYEKKGSERTTRKVYGGGGEDKLRRICGQKATR